MVEIEASTLSLLLTQDQVTKVREFREFLEDLNATYKENPDSYRKETLAKTLAIAAFLLKDMDDSAVRLYDTVREWANANDEPA